MVGVVALSLSVRLPLVIVVLLGGEAWSVPLLVPLEGVEDETVGKVGAGAGGRICEG